MGMAELVPGVSGGTVALVTGIYPKLLTSGDAVVNAGKTVVLGPYRSLAVKKLREIDWFLLVPLAIGMLTIVGSMAGVMTGFVEGQPEISKGLFAGMVAASIVVPIRMAKTHRGKGKLVGTILVVGAAIAAFVLSGLPSSSETANPPLYVVFLAAMVAICALALPGVSGSYLLLVMGLYEPTLTAVAQRNFEYIAVFGVGAVIGISLFVHFLNRLLRDHGWATLLIMSGLMLGSLRALWPWQTEANAALAPTDNWPMVLGMFVLGAAIVFGVVAAERHFTAQEPAPQTPNVP